MVLKSTKELLTFWARSSNTKEYSLSGKDSGNFLFLPLLIAILICNIQCFLGLTTSDWDHTQSSLLFLWSSLTRPTTGVSETPVGARRDFKNRHSTHKQQKRSSTFDNKLNCNQFVLLLC